jgi:CheY-like chemotaxis protein
MPPATPLNARLTVLHVEDDPDIRDVVCELLEAEGYEVVQAPHGQRALELLQAGLRPCVVLLDLMMPVMDGATFLARLRAIPSLAALPVVIVSASRPVPGAVAVLGKPFELDALLGTVRRFRAAAAAA